MFSEDMFADEYASPSSTAKMIANQVSTFLVKYEIGLLDMFADEYASPSSTAKMIANQVSTVLVKYVWDCFVTFT